MYKHFGVEIEFTGVSRMEVAEALSHLFGEYRRAVIRNKQVDPYTSYDVTDWNGNIWKVLRDKSIKPFRNPRALGETCASTGCRLSARDPDDYMVEIVSPVLSYNTLNTLFTVVNVIKAIGGVVNDSCGVHVHMDALPCRESIDLYKRFVQAQDNI